MSEAPKSYWIKSGFFSLFEKGSALLFGLGGFMILTRAWTKEDLGLWVLFALMCSIAEVGRAGLQQNALVKYLSTAEGKEIGKISTASLFNNLVITAIIIAALLFFGQVMEAFFKGPGLSALLRIYCFTTFFLVFFQQFNFTQQANLEFEGIFWSNLTFRGSFFFYILYIYLSGGEMIHENLAWFQAIAALVASGVSLLFVRKYLSFSFRVDWTWVKKLFDFGRYGFGTNMSTMLHKNLDKLMVTTLLGTPALVIYDWAVRMTMVIEVPTFSIASVVYPKSSQEFKNSGLSTLANLYEKSTGAILAIILPFMIGGFIFAEQIIIFFATEGFLESVPVLRTALCFGFFIPYAVMFGTIIDSIGKPKLNFWFTFFGFVTNIIANYICITSFGVIGAAYGTLFSWAVLTIAGQVVLNNLLGVQFLKPFKHILPYYREMYKKGLALYSKTRLT